MREITNGKSLTLSHKLLFVDDVILFGLGTVRQAGKYQEILDLYFRETHMEVDLNKLNILFNNLVEEQEWRIFWNCPFKESAFDNGVIYLKYLGFVLNPNDYRVKEYNSLYEKMVEYQIGATYGSQEEDD